jgi:hypothetical protein
VSAETLSPRVGRLVEAWDALLDAIDVVDESDLSTARWAELESALMATALHVRYRPRSCAVPPDDEREGPAA